MKKRVTLSLNARTVKTLRIFSMRKRVPMGTVVEAIGEEMEKKERAKEDDFA